MDRAKELQDRTKKFALRVIKLVQSLPKTSEGRVIGRQLLRSATSVAANYRAACRGRSNKEFYAKLCIIVEEADESAFWLELLIDAEIVPESKLKPLLEETNEILKIMAKSKKTVKQKLDKNKASKENQPQENQQIEESKNRQVNK